MMTKEDELRLERKIDGLTKDLSEFMSECRVEFERSSRTLGDVERLSNLNYHPQEGLVVRITQLEGKCRLLLWITAALFTTTLGIIVNNVLKVLT